ncbi:MAG: hypothetical protein ACHQ7M_12670 [Chloroflexota bacterium]
MATSAEVRGSRRTPGPWALAAALSLLLAACSSLTPLPRDQAVHLASGQGLAALMIDTLDPLTDVEVASRSGGPKLRVAAVPVGISIYLFQVPAGTYCMTRFKYGTMSLSGASGVLGCFAVRAGDISYSGTLAPRVEEGKPITHQVQDPEGFRILLTQQYPQVAREFAPGP